MKVRLEQLLKPTVAAALCALAVSACGSQQKPAASAPGTTTTAAANHRTVWIYSSLPQAGPDSAAAAQIRAGIKLALAPVMAQKSYDGFQIRYRWLNDSATRVVVHHTGSAAPSTSDKSHSGTTLTRNGNTDGWNTAATVRAAERAAGNPKTIAYIGDLNSEATELSLPILNQAGILQITPGSGYAGLTDNFRAPITQPGEPGRYYPNKKRTLLRLIPSDVVQAAAAIETLHQAGCERVAAWQFDRTQVAGSLFAAVQQTAAKYGMAYVPTTAPPRSIGKLYGYVLMLKPKQIGCAVLVGHVTHTAAMLTTYLREQLQSSPPIVGTDGFCNSDWVRWIPKAYAAKVVPGLYCTTPSQPVRDFPGGNRFKALFRAAYPHAPVTAYGYYGYEAVQIVLRALHQLGGGGDTRDQVFTSVAADILYLNSGTYTYDRNGNDEYSTAYGISYFPHGTLRHYKTLAPSALLSSAG